MCLGTVPRHFYKGMKLGLKKKKKNLQHWMKGSLFIITQKGYLLLWWDAQLQMKLDSLCFPLLWLELCQIVPKESLEEAQIPRREWEFGNNQRLIHALQGEDHGTLLLGNWYLSLWDLVVWGTRWGYFLWTYKQKKAYFKTDQSHSHEVINLGLNI